MYEKKMITGKNQTKILSCLWLLKIVSHISREIWNPGNTGNSSKLLWAVDSHRCQESNANACKRVVFQQFSTSL